MERENIQHFYVFTDTSCNYGFYEYMNMFRRGTKRVKLKVNHRLEEFSFFLYENFELNAELAGTGRFVDANDFHLVPQIAAEEVQL